MYWVRWICGHSTIYLSGFPGGSDGKESACNAGDPGSIPREDPLEKAMATHFISVPREFYGQRSLVGCGPWDSRESDTTEQLHFHFSLSCTGEGNGNPLQRSCLENPRDGGAWWAAVYGVAQSRTQLKWLSSNSSSLKSQGLTQGHMVKQYLSKEESRHTHIHSCPSSHLILLHRAPINEDKGQERNDLEPNITHWCFCNTVLSWLFSEQSFPYLCPFSSLSSHPLMSVWRIVNLSQYLASRLSFSHPGHELSKLTCITCLQYCLENSV